MTEPFLVRPDIVDGERRRAAVESLRAAQVTLPSWSELADPARIPAAIGSSLKSVGPDEPNAKNLWRVHWFNDADRRDRAPVPGHVVLPEALTGVKAPIVVLMGRRFPMIGAHKVLAAYACLAPRLVSGRFDPTRQRAIWPSTGNYCRGGVAISRILGCRGVAVLPEGMSAERFEWLRHWVTREETTKRFLPGRNLELIGLRAARNAASVPSAADFECFSTNRCSSPSSLPSTRSICRRGGRV